MVVIGGGIGGLSTALMIAKLGKRVCVLEQAQQFAEIGAGIQLGPNAFKMFGRLGITDEVKAVSAFPDSLMMRDNITGEIVADIPAGEHFTRHFGYPYAVIHRADLHAILLRHCEALGLIDLRTNSNAIDVSQDDTRVEVRTEAGLLLHGAAVIGADGLWSRVRQLIVADGDARVSGHIAYRAVLKTEDVPPELNWNTMCLWGGEKAHLVQYPLRRGELFNLVAVFHSDRHSEGWNAYGDPEELNLRFSDKCAQVQTLLERIESWRMWVLCDRDPVRIWSDRRMTLAGDAAHPMLQYLAQGANMAMEDAVCISDMLVNEDFDYPAAFQRYQQARYLRTARVQMTARLYGEVYHASGAVRDMRNAEIASWQVQRHYLGMDWLYNIEDSWLDNRAERGAAALKDA